MNDRELRRNAEGYLDPTAYQAIKNVEKGKRVDKEDDDFHRLLHTIFYLCELADFRIEGRIVLIDKKTGKYWR